MSDDELDPADWLSNQFGSEPEPDKRPRRRGVPALPPEQPVAPAPPASPFPPQQSAPFVPPPAVAAPPAATTPSATPAAAAAPTEGGGFFWGLTPGGGASTPPTAPATPAAAPPAALSPAAPSPAVPPTEALPAEAQPTRRESLAGLFRRPRADRAAPAAAPPAADTPPADPLAGLLGQPAPAPAPEAPTEAWDTPTVATPVQPEQPDTVAFRGREIVRQEFPGFGAPIDPALDGVTEVHSAQPVGLGAPEDEGLEVSAIDSLFGEASFVEYEEALIPVLPPRASGGSELVVVERPRVTEERAGIPQLQKVLMGVAGGLVAVLLLIVLYLAGTKIGAATPAPVAADPSPSASAPVQTVGPLAPGEYYWDRLLGGECIAPFVSPWEDTFTVVDCGQAHPAQLLLKGTFPATEDPAYPGVDALQTLAASLCAAPTVVDYAAAASANDIQILSSFAADSADWDAGNRTFYCFASRTGGAEFTTSIAVPQAAATSTPAP